MPFPDPCFEGVNLSNVVSAQMEAIEEVHVGGTGRASGLAMDAEKKQESADTVRESDDPFAGLGESQIKVGMTPLPGVSVPGEGLYSAKDVHVEKESPAIVLPVEVAESSVQAVTTGQEDADDFGEFAEAASILENPGPVRMEWSPSDHDVDVSKYLFEVADIEKVGKLSGSSAVRFLTKSGLDRAYLRQIWELSDTQKIHALGIVEFQKALRYVSLAQNGHPPSPTVLAETAGMPFPDPCFEGVDVPMIVLQGSRSQEDEDSKVVSHDPFASLGNVVVDAPLPTLAFEVDPESCSGNTVPLEEKMNPAIDKAGTYMGDDAEQPSFIGDSSQNNVEENDGATSGRDSDDFGDFEEANTDSALLTRRMSSIVAENASLIDSFAVEESASPEPDQDILSNLAEFALTGAPISPSAFAGNAKNDNKFAQQNPGSRRNSRGIDDLSFLPSMQTRFEGPLDALVNELVNQERLEEAEACQAYVVNQGEREEEYEITNPWRECRPAESVKTFASMKEEVANVCGNESLLVSRFCELFPFANPDQKEELTKLASENLQKLVALFRKAEMVVRVIIGINGENGEYQKHAEHWILVLSHCNAEFTKAFNFLKETVVATNTYNARVTEHPSRQISVSKILKTEKIETYLKCLFEMFKVCCSLQIWTVNSENQRKPLLSEMEKLKKTWRQLGGLSRKYGRIFPKIKMITFKHIDELTVISDKEKLCHLSLLPLCDDDSKVVYAGNVYRTACANYWLNNIAMTAP